MRSHRTSRRRGGVAKRFLTTPPRPSATPPRLRRGVIKSQISNRDTTRAYDSLSEEIHEAYNLFLTARDVGHGYVGSNSSCTVGHMRAIGWIEFHLWAASARRPGARAQHALVDRQRNDGG